MNVGAWLSCQKLIIKPTLRIVSPISPLHNDQSKQTDRSKRTNVMPYLDCVYPTRSVGGNL